MKKCSSEILHFSSTHLLFPSFLQITKFQFSDSLKNFTYSFFPAKIFFAGLYRHYYHNSYEHFFDKNKTLMKFLTRSDN